jgi:hypothetical protein
MTAAYPVWLLLVGLAVGAALTWLVLADLGRREASLDADRLEDEADWIADALAAEGRPTSRDSIARILRLDRSYRRDDGPAHPPPAAGAATDVAAEVTAPGSDAGR